MQYTCASWRRQKFESASLALGFAYRFLSPAGCHLCLGSGRSPVPPFKHACSQGKIFEKISRGISVDEFLSVVCILLQIVPFLWLSVTCVRARAYQRFNRLSKHALSGGFLRKTHVGVESVPASSSATHTGRASGLHFWAIILWAVWLCSSFFFKGIVQKVNHECMHRKFRNMQKRILNQM